MTYMIDVRHGGPSSGYISSGFFGGKRAIKGADAIEFRSHPRLDCGSSCFPVG